MTSVPPAGDDSVKFDIPYVGLLPFSEKNADYFFGRTSDIEKTATNLRAAPLTIFYGTSGVGKSSLLNAGVIPYLRRMATISILPDEPPEFILVVLRDWATDPFEGLKEEIAESIAETLKTAKIPKKGSNDAGELKYLTREDVETEKAANKSGRDMEDLLRNWTTFIDTKLLIIFDQFEDFFRKAEFRSGEGSFGEEFSKAARSKDLPVNFMLSLRDDSVSKLDVFKDKIPDLMRNTLRLEHLDRNATDEAIRRPIDKFNELNNTGLGGRLFTIENDLVTNLIEDLRVGNNDFDTTVQAKIEQSGQQHTRVAADDDYKVETPFLQIVMITLWEDKVTQDTRNLSLETLTRLGGVKEIVKTHLNKVISSLLPSEQDVLAEFIHFMIAGDRKNSPLSAAELANWADHPDKTNAIQNILEKMSTGDNRIFKSVSSIKGMEGSYYEVTHDALAPAILGWRARYKENKRISELGWKQFRKWGLRVGIVGLILFTIAAAFSYWNYLEKDKALEDAQSAFKKQQDQLHRASELTAELEARKDDIADKNKQALDIFRISEKLSQGTEKEKNAALTELQASVEKNPLTPELQASFLSLIDKRADPKTLNRVNSIIGTKKTAATPTVYVYFADTHQSAAQPEIAGLLKGVDIVPKINIVSNSPSSTQLRYFHDDDDDRAMAAQVIALLANAGVNNIKAVYVSDYENQIPQKQLELWFSPDALADTAYVKTRDGGSINFRDTPNGNYDENFTIPNGGMVKRQICQARKATAQDGTTGHWCRVWYGDQNGWVFDGYLVYTN